MTNLIPISYLNEACFLTLNENDKKYKMVLEISQDALKQLLGREFYIQIEAQYSANTLTADNEALYDPHIKKYLAWQTYMNYLGFANSNSTPTGIRKFNDENSEVLTGIEMYAFEKKVLEKVNFYKGEMINFLKESQANDATKYPLWVEQFRAEFSFGITPADAKSNLMFKINKETTNNG